MVGKWEMAPKCGSLPRDVGDLESLTRQFFFFFCTILFSHLSMSSSHLLLSHPGFFILALTIHLLCFLSLLHFSVFLFQFGSMYQIKLAVFKRTLNLHHCIVLFVYLQQGLEPRHHDSSLLQSILVLGNVYTLSSFLLFVVNCPPVFSNFWYIWVR